MSKNNQLDKWLKFSLKPSDPDPYSVTDRSTTTPPPAGGGNPQQARFGDKVMWNGKEYYLKDRSKNPGMVLISEDNTNTVVEAPLSELSLANQSAAPNPQQTPPPGQNGGNPQGIVEGDIVRANITQSADMYIVNTIDKLNQATLIDAYNKKPKKEIGSNVDLKVALADLYPAIGFSDGDYLRNNKDKSVYIFDKTTNTLTRCDNNTLKPTTDIIRLNINFVKNSTPIPKAQIEKMKAELNYGNLFPNMYVEFGGNYYIISKGQNDEIFLNELDDNLNPTGAAPIPYNPSMRSGIRNITKAELDKIRNTNVSPIEIGDYVRYQNKIYLAVADPNNPNNPNSPIQLDSLGDFLVPNKKPIPIKRFDPRLLQPISKDDISKVLGFAQGDKATIETKEKTTFSGTVSNVNNEGDIALTTNTGEVVSFNIINITRVTRPYNEQKVDESTDYIYGRVTPEAIKLIQKKWNETVPKLPNKTTVEKMNAILKVLESNITIVSGYTPGNNGNVTLDYGNTGTYTFPYYYVDFMKKENNQWIRVPHKEIGAYIQSKGLKIRPAAPAADTSVGQIIINRSFPDLSIGINKVKGWLGKQASSEEYLELELLREIMGAE